MSVEIKISGIELNNIKEEKVAVFNSRLYNAVEKILERSISSDELNIMFNSVQGKLNEEVKESASENDFLERSKHYKPQRPLWTFEKLILSENVLDEIETALSVIENEKIVFDDWGLRAIEPFPRSALNFYGPPGTGKTMAAHAIANRLGKEILSVSYADIESKYHGEGPKNIEAIFAAAYLSNSVLFIDEADSLLSKRLLNVTQGSEQAINSIRSQLLICLEKFNGIVIFATNLVKNYDYAFETRIKHIHFPLPDHQTRAKIWDMHLLFSIPKNDNINIDQLAEYFSTFCGRDIKNAVINACLSAVKNQELIITHEHLMKAAESISLAKQMIRNFEDPYTLSSEERKELEKQITTT